MGAPSIGQVLRATLIADYETGHLKRLFAALFIFLVSAELSADDAEPELPQPAVLTLNIQRMNVRT
jgi:hypothetical protein